MPKYVGVPYIKGSSTSQAAAKSVNAGNQRQRAWEFIASQGAHGATAQEVNKALGIKHGCCTRVTELVRLGRIERTQRTRKTSTGRSAKIHVAIAPKDWVDKRSGWPCPTKGQTQQETAIWRRRAYSVAKKYKEALDRIKELEQQLGIQQ